MSQIKVGIVGGTGYTGAELLRLLTAHPQVTLQTITSRKEAGLAVSEIFPHLRGITNLAFSEPDFSALSACDVVFFATPHGVCMKEARELLNHGVKVIDLSADFRLKNPDTFAKWYKTPHIAPDLLEEAVYGLPEIWREDIKTARLIAGAGCYPTAVQLGFKPLLESGFAQTTGLIADVKSGVSGAGREAKIGNLFAEMGESFKAYAASGHRHQPEIEQGLSQMTGVDTHCVFVPHLVPMIRGIEATLYARLQQKIDLNTLHGLYEKAYQHEQFVDVLPLGHHPETRSVRGSNMLRIGVFLSPDGETAIISATEDNLVKGASGQAVQCMNLMFNLPEQMGLLQTALLP